MFLRLYVKNGKLYVHEASCGKAAADARESDLPGGMTAFASMEAVVKYHWPGAAADRYDTADYLGGTVLPSQRREVEARVRDLTDLINRVHFHDCTAGLPTYSEQAVQ